MNYIEIRFQNDPDFTEILIAELAELGCESFVETPEGLNAYLPEEAFDEAQLQTLVARYQATADLQSSWTLIPKTNWNEEWERSYEPIEVGDCIRVRAAFHTPDPRFEHELLITPKMSFGTGHHETTWLVMNEQLSLPHQGRTILDVGCGTGILAILAHRLGATHLTAFDIDEWAVANTLENFELNTIPDEMTLFQGTIEQLETGQTFGGILANINRNILLAEIPRYVQFLAKGAWLVVSGFYESDKNDIIACAEQHGLRVHRTNTRNQWATVVFYT
jgi:ribosomal protein L11 methyltransferase